MERVTLVLLMGLGAWAVVWLLGKPLRLLLRVAVGSGVLWLFDSLCGRFGVRLSASAPSLHVMRADIHSTVTPIVGSEKQSEELVDYILGEFEDDPAKLWDSNIFGKSLHELINEGLAAKIAHVSGESGVRFRETLERVINEGSGGMICIIL